MVVIRLSRQGRKNRPFYAMVVAEKSARRDGRHIEKVGSYNPLSKEIIMNLDRVEYWLSVGAQPSDKAKIIIKQFRSSNKAAAA